MSRLKKIAEELHNRDYDIENLYSSIEESMTNIRQEISNVQNTFSNTSVQTFIDDTSIIKECINTIIDYASDIDAMSSECKMIGQHNEDRLNDGNKIIHEIESKLSDVQDDLSQMQNSNDELEHEIKTLQESIEELKGTIEELDLENQNIEASNVNSSRLLVNAAYSYICHVHDAMSDKAADIVQTFSSFGDSLNIITEISEEELQSIVENGESQCYNVLQILFDLEDDMKIGLKMNGRMGGGIDSKNEIIDELKEQLEEVIQELDELSDTYSSLIDHRDALDNDLDNLNNIT